METVPLALPVSTSQLPLPPRVTPAPKDFTPTNSSRLFVQRVPKAFTVLPQVPQRARPVLLECTTINSIPLLFLLAATVRMEVLRRPLVVQLRWVRVPPSVRRVRLVSLTRLVLLPVLLVSA